MVAVGKLALRQREAPCAMRASEGRLLLTTLFYPDEIKVNPEIDVSEVEVSEAELDIALKLIDMLSGSFETDGFQDDYREALMKQISAKIEGREFVEAKAPAPAEAVDLVAALKASIEAAERDATSDAAPAAEVAAPAKTKPKKATRKGGGKKKPGRKRQATAKT